MSRLHREKDVTTLQQAVQLLERENDKLSERVVELTRKLVVLEGGGNGQLQLQIAELERQLAARNKALFGDSSEKRPRDSQSASEPKERRGHGPKAQPELEIVPQEYELDEADRVCTACGGALDEWAGQHEESEEVDVIARRFVLVRHLRKKYRCRCGGCIETAPSPLKLCEGGRYSLGFAIEVAASKYLDHLPLERQVRIMRREGLEVDSQTLWDQLSRLAHVLSPTHEALRQHVLASEVIGVDETSWLLMGAKKNEQHKRWQVWAAVTTDAVCYQLHDNRSTRAAAALLDGFAGTVMCDGYAAYKALAKDRPELRLAHCWAHARRMLLEAEHEPEAREALELVQRLFEIERRSATGPPGEQQRRQLRQDESARIVRELHTWLMRSKSRPESPLGRATRYLADHWQGLTRFVADARIPLHNNASERALRGVVIGRKNHYGSRSRRGTQVAALFYSLLESAKLAGVEPKAYLRAAAVAALRGETIPLPHQLPR